MSKSLKSMTEGTPRKLIIAFALPLMAGNVFQQLYTIVDTMVVGRYLGVKALAALGADDWLSWMMLGIVEGFAQGFAIKMAYDYGAKDEKSLKKTIGNSVVIAILFSVGMTIIGEAVAAPALRLLRTKSTIWSDAICYLRLIYLGTPIIMLYNLFASILRALGDSKTPLRAMIVASIVNIGLDLLFVMVFHWGIAGAAFGTICGQLVSSLYCLYYMRKLPLLSLGKSDFRLERKLGGYLLYLGLPMALQNAIIAIGGMVVQSVVNLFSVAFIGGFTAVNKLYGLLEIAATSYGFAMVTYTGQNLGAGNINRVRHGVRSASGIAMVTSVVIMTVILVFGREIVGMFMSGTPKIIKEATDVGYHYISIMAICLPILYELHVLRSTIQGMGNTILPMISGVAEFCMRTGVALIFSMLVGEQGIYFAEVAAWIGSMCVLVPSYVVLRKRMN
ncbi:putative efflux protein, MATE family [Lachnospiraceae bacterium XBB1006]|nr:putative efflux protein, MATE family [Lachnospiraceae bacterium XBB1006]